MRFKQQPKRQGQWAEIQFLARAAEEGLEVSRPWGDMARYDFIVEHRGRISRVQVKSTAYAHPCGSFVCTTTSRLRGASYPRRQYRSSEVDFVACLIVPRRIWFILPLAALRALHSSVFLRPGCKRSRYTKYQEAWSLFKTPAKNRQKKDRQKRRARGSTGTQRRSQVGRPPSADGRR